MLYKLRNGKRIFYDIINEKGSNGTVFFLNGVMASVSSWKFQIEALIKEDYKIVVHDFIGQLLSDKFEGLYSFEQHSLDLYELIQYLNEDKIHLIGTSYGGEVAMKFASIFPKVAKSMTVINSVSELDEKVVKIVEEWVELAKSYNGKEFFEKMLPSIYGQTYIVNNRDFLSQRALAMNGIPKSYFDGQIGLYKTFINDVYMTDILSNIQCPSLIIVGEEDTLKPVKFSQIIADNLSNSQLKIIPDCGHVTIFEKPAELNTYLIEFLKDVN